MHDLLIVGVPLVAILAGIFFNNSQFDKIEARMNARFEKLEKNVDSRLDRLESRLDRMQSDLSQFYITLGKHKVRLDVLEKREAKQRFTSRRGVWMLRGGVPPVRTSRSSRQ